ncbi:hypothetical protein A3Q56_05743 [Intoshia linei]|uniref:Uncharacterized protein n=1 Tax=Intoshia linei TaxID=1819745 RepID=A0A177AX07_9BILA|nr:hypothetical protein A3Q56_05743 [Intoshia linei]
MPGGVCIFCRFLGKIAKYSLLFMRGLTLIVTIEDMCRPLIFMIKQCETFNYVLFKFLDDLANIDVPLPENKNQRLKSVSKKKVIKFILYNSAARAIRFLQQGPNHNSAQF